MLKISRLTALAAVVFVVLATTVAPSTAFAQGQPASPPGTPSASTPPATPPADASAAPAAPKAGATKTLETIDNPYGLEALWKGGDMVAKVTLAILAIMSMGSWYIIITKVYEQAKMNAQGRAAQKTFWTAPSVQQGV